MAAILVFCLALESTCLTAVVIVFSSPKGSPFSVIITSLSASGSITIPISALCFFTSRHVRLRFSGRGSGFLVNIPDDSQSTLITLQPSFSSSAGIIFEPEAFTQSTTTLNFLFLILLILSELIFSTFEI